MEFDNPRDSLNYFNELFSSERFQKIKRLLTDPEATALLSKEGEGYHLSSTSGPFHRLRAEVMRLVAANITDRGREFVPIEEGKALLVNEVVGLFESYRDHLKRLAPSVAFDEEALSGKEPLPKELSDLKAIYRKNSSLISLYDRLKYPAESFQDAVEEIEKEFQQQKAAHIEGVKREESAVQEVNRLVGEIDGGGAGATIYDSFERISRFAEENLPRKKGESYSNYLKRLADQAPNCQALLKGLSQLREVWSQKRGAPLEIPLEELAAAEEKIASIDDSYLSELKSWIKRCGANRRRYQKKVDEEKRMLFHNLQQTLKPLVDCCSAIDELPDALPPLNDLFIKAKAFSSESDLGRLEHLYDSIVKNHLGNHLEGIISEAEELLHRGEEEEERLHHYVEIEEFAKRLKDENPSYKELSLSELVQKCQEELSSLAKESGVLYSGSGAQERERLLSKETRERMKGLHSFISDYAKKYSDKEIEERLKKAGELFDFIEIAKETEGERPLEEGGVDHYRRQHEVDEAKKVLIENLFVLKSRSPKKNLEESIDPKLIEKVEGIEKQEEELKEREKILSERREGKIALLAIAEGEKRDKAA